MVLASPINLQVAQFRSHQADRLDGGCIMGFDREKNNDARRATGHCPLLFFGQSKTCAPVTIQGFH
jgi:hypothetical protein